MGQEEIPESALEGGTLQFVEDGRVAVGTYFDELFVVFLLGGVDDRVHEPAD
jgi:hypothetical protein